MAGQAASEPPLGAKRRGMVRGIIKGVDALVAIVAGALLLALLAVVTLAVVSRQLNDPVIWTDEVSRFLMVWLACLGWVMVSRKRGHIRVQFFANLLPAGMRRGSELLMQLLVAAFGVALTWHGAALVIRNIGLEALTLPIPIAIMYVPLVIAGYATAMQGLAEAVDVLRPTATARRGA